MAKLEKSAGAVIYCENGPCFLLLKNTLKTTYWEFPKGHVDINESLEETARREAEEETGLKNLKIINGFKHSLHWFFKFQGKLISKEAVYFLIKVNEEDKNKVKISSEHEDFAWLSFEEALDTMKIKGNRELLIKACEFILENNKQKTLV